MTARLLAFLVWGALAATAMFWGLRLGGSSPAMPKHALAVSAAVPARGDLTRVLGAEPPPTAAAPVEAAPQAASRFRLVGLMAPRSGGREGIALLQVDGKPARPYRVGALVDGDWVLQSVQPRSIALGPRGGAEALRLELPPLPVAATGTLPPADLATLGGQAPGQAPGGPQGGPQGAPGGVPGVPVPGVPPQGNELPAPIVQPGT
jgi:general secretion pathway protein C